MFLYGCVGMDIRVWLVCVLYAQLQIKNPITVCTSGVLLHGIQWGNSVTALKQNLTESSFFEISTSNLEHNLFI